MPKSLILLLLLCLLLTGLIAPAAQASSLVLGPEHPIADPGFGGVSESFVAVVPAPAGFTAFTNDVNHQVLIATPLSPAGVPDLAARHIVGPSATVAISKGAPLLFWSDGRTAYSARMGNRPNVVASTSGVRSAACNDQECLVVIDFTVNRIVMTDSEGVPKTDARAIPTVFFRYPAETTVVPDPNGFTIFQNAGWLIGGQQLVRVDHEGRVVWTVKAPDLTAAALWNGDHNVLLVHSITAERYIGAVDVDANGNLSAIRPLVQTSSTITPFHFARRGDRFVLAVQNLTLEDLYDVDAGWTSATLTMSVALEAPFLISGLIATDSALIAQLSSGSAIGTMGIHPQTRASLLSAGPLSQQAAGIAETSTGYVVAWTEPSAVPLSRPLYAAHLTHDGTVTDRVQLAADGLVVGIPMRTVGDDALIVWSDGDGKRSRGAIVHPGGTFDAIEFNSTTHIRTIVARENDWVAITNPDIATPAAAIRIARSGMIFPPKAIPGTATAVLGADSDGRSIFIDTVDQILLLNADLDVARRIPQVIQSFQHDVAFSNGSYLLADGEKLTRFDRGGNAVSSTPFRYSTTPRVVSIERGWLVISGSTVTTVLPGDPPVIEISVAIPHLPNFASIASRSDNRVGMLFSRAVETHGLLSTRLFLRELSLEDVARRRAVMSR